jgi:CBS domain-containing protein
MYRETIRNPLGHDLYARRAFFDLAPLQGDTAMLDSLREHVANELRECSMTIPLLANDTLANLPPLTFFQGLVLEMDGAQRESFDIAETVTVPVASAARVLALARGRLAPAGTLARLAMAAGDEPEHAAVFREAAAAFRIGLYYQTRNGGPRIEPGHLEKRDQLLLKTAFAAVQRFLEFTVARFVAGAA